MNITSNTNAISTQMINSDTTTRQMTTDPAKEILMQIVGADTVGANVAAIKTEDQTIGTLLDIKT